MLSLLAREGRYLFSFMPEEEDKIHPLTSDDHGINEYIKSPCVSMETNLLKFGKTMKKNGK
jgi:hypothetical protein